MEAACASRNSAANNYSCALFPFPTQLHHFVQPAKMAVMLKRRRKRRSATKRKRKPPQQTAPRAEMARQPQVKYVASHFHVHSLQRHSPIHLSALLYYRKTQAPSPPCPFAKSTLAVPCRLAKSSTTKTSKQTISQSQPCSLFYSSLPCSFISVSLFPLHALACSNLQRTTSAETRARDALMDDQIQQLREAAEAHRCDFALSTTVSIAGPPLCSEAFSSPSSFFLLIAVCASTFAPSSSQA